MYASAFASGSASDGSASTRSMSSPSREPYRCSRWSMRGRRPPVLLADRPGLALEHLEPLGADQREVVRDGRQAGGAAADGEVDGVLGHHAVGGELAAGDDRQARRRGGDGVLARHLGRAGAGLDLGLEQRPQTRPGADDVLARDRPGQHRVGVLDDVVDVRARRDGVHQLLLPRRVRGADHPVPRPRDDEQDRLLGLQDQPDVAGDAAARDDDVDALAGQHAQAALGARQRLGLLGPHAGRVDDGPRPDVDVLAGLQVDHLGAGDRAAAWWSAGRATCVRVAACAP